MNVPYSARRLSRRRRGARAAAASAPGPTGQPPSQVRAGAGRPRRVLGHQFVDPADEVGLLGAALARLAPVVQDPPQLLDAQLAQVRGAQVDLLVCGESRAALSRARRCGPSARAGDRRRGEEPGRERSDGCTDRYGRRGSREGERRRAPGEAEGTSKLGVRQQIRLLTLKVIIRSQKVWLQLGCRSFTIALKSPLLYEQQHFSSLFHWLKKR